MRERKRKKLKTKGCRIGTPKDFFETSDEEDAYVNLRLRLAEGLNERRQARGVTRVGLAQAINSNESRVARRKQETRRYRSTCW